MLTIQQWCVLLALGGVAFGGCATPYQEMGFLGGVAAPQITTDTYRIVSRGNGHTSTTAVADYALLKAAETTKQAGGTHFVVISAADASRTELTTGSVQTHVAGNMAFSTYTPPQAYLKPGQDTYIRVLTLAPGRTPPAGSFSADEIIQFVGSRVPREKA